MYEGKENQPIDVTIGQDDFGTLCVCALRYCHGRRTYMPSLVQGIVTEHLSELSDKDLSVMKDDCQRQQRDFSLYGDLFVDKPGWLCWADRVNAEIEKRGKQHVSQGNQTRIQRRDNT